MTKEPTFRVRRPARVGYKPGRPFRAYDDIDPEKLRLLAAIAIEFNDCEEALQMAVGLLIGNAELKNDIVSRINGLEGMVEIAKRACRQSLTLSGEPAEAICTVLSAFMLYKTYRDTLAHVRLHNEADDIVFTYIRRGKMYEADISKDTLRAVYEHMYHLSDEMVHMFRMVEHNWSEADLELGWTDAKTVRSGPKLQESFFQLQECLSQRASLPDIPEFPATPQAPKGSEEPE